MGAYWVRTINVQSHWAHKSEGTGPKQGPVYVVNRTIIGPGCGYDSVYCTEFIQSRIGTFDLGGAALS